MGGLIRAKLRNVPDEKPGQRNAVGDEEALLLEGKHGREGGEGLEAVRVLKMGTDRRADFN